MKKYYFVVLLSITISCTSEVEKVKPSKAAITESVYASGIVKSNNQYQVFANVSGIINEILVTEGDTVKAGDVLFKLVDDAARLNRENAALNAQFADIKTNSGKLNEARLMLDLAKSKLRNDSLLLERQRGLWKQQVGSKVELEQRELAFENSKSAYYSAGVKYHDLVRQLELNASVSQRNLAISNKMESDFSIKSEIDGIVYSINKNKGELIGPQTSIAIIGDAKEFILELQVDEYDILKIKKGQQVIVTLDSYKNQTFEARVTKINPIMNERSKTFMVEAQFVKAPALLYPNVSVEANILLITKSNALLIPRICLLKDSLVIKANGDTVKVSTGLKDYQKIEVLSGLDIDDELLIPKE